MRAPFSKVKSVEKALTDLVSLVGESTYNFNPELKEVFLDKGGTSALAIKDVLKLSSIPNKRLGTVEISLDPAEARKSTSKKVLIFTFPGKGERRLTSSEILAGKASSENRLNEKAKAIAAEDPFKIKLPVFRTEGATYLVQAVPLNPGHDDEGKGVIGDSAVVVPNFYTWIKSDGVTLKYKAGEMDELPLFEIPYPDSPSLEFRMERGVNFQKSGEPWTSVKIYAMPLDFDASKQVDENGNEGYLSRKKTFLREIFFPVYNPQKHINFWLGWKPGC